MSFTSLFIYQDESGSTDISPSIQTPIVIPTANLDLTSSFGNWSNAATTCEDCCACDETENWRQDGLWYSMAKRYWGRGQFPPALLSPHS
jgi:hypothetical protein